MQRYSTKMYSPLVTLAICTPEACYRSSFFLFEPTLFTGSLILPPKSTRAPGDGKMRDPGNEVVFDLAN